MQKSCWNDIFLQKKCEKNYFQICKSESSFKKVATNYYTNYYCSKPHKQEITRFGSAKCFLLQYLKNWCLYIRKFIAVFKKMVFIYCTAVFEKLLQYLKNWCLYVRKTIAVFEKFMFIYKKNYCRIWKSFLYI